MDQMSKKHIFLLLHHLNEADEVIFSHVTQKCIFRFLPLEINDH